MTKLIIFLAAALFPLQVMAQDKTNIETTVEICATCHGENGLPEDPEIPIIWGQEYYYIYLQLKDYAAGRRASDIMGPIASELSRDQMKTVAEYFSGKVWPAIQAEAKDSDEEVAEKAATGGQCSACHGKWDGNSNVPRVAGQQPAYLELTMLNFKNGIRNNAPDKTATMQQLTDESIVSLSRYLATRSHIAR